MVSWFINEGTSYRIQYSLWQVILQLCNDAMVNLIELDMTLAQVLCSGKIFKFMLNNVWYIKIPRAKKFGSEKKQNKVSIGYKPINME